ncbi:MAG: hypothetical protein RIF41_33810, partial [Polyangiaceae bacterium]
MIDLDRFHEIGQTMRRNALRTVLTAVGVFWGVFLLVVMVGFGNGLEDGARKSMGGWATSSGVLRVRTIRSAVLPASKPLRPRRPIVPIATRLGWMRSTA